MATKTKPLNFSAVFGSVCLILYALTGYLSPAYAKKSQRNDVNIVIAIDCSWSVNSYEFELQVKGIASVFTDPVVLEAIKQGRHGSIGVILTQWSTYESQEISIPWTRISDLSDAVRFSLKSASARRLTIEGGTSISGALLHAQSTLNTAPFKADRHIINLVADGENNNGQRVEPVRENLVALGTTINALAIMNEFHWLHHYLRNRVIGGSGAFVQQTADYYDFVAGFRKKLLREIRGELVTYKPLVIAGLGASYPTP